MGIRNKWIKFTALMVVVCFVFSVPAFAVESTGDIPNIAVANRVLDNGEIVTCVASQKTPLLVESVKSDNGQIATLLVYEVNTESAQEGTITPKVYDDRQVSTQYDLVYVQNGQTLSVYRATIVGTISTADSSNRQITSVSFAYRSGLTCATSSAIRGYTASLAMAPPNFPASCFIVTLGSGGSFQITSP